MCVARAKATTSDKDTDQANNSGSGTVTVKAPAPPPSVTETFSTGNIAVSIPSFDNVFIPLSIATDKAILDIDASVRLNHTQDDDVEMWLVAPDGLTTVELSTDNGADGDDYGTETNNCAGTHTRFDDAAATSITAGAAPFAGSFRPEGSLATFNGRSTSGTWFLEASDDGPLTGHGTIGCFKLRIKHSP